jgi:hypothetical protein
LGNPDHLAADCLKEGKTGRPNVNFKRAPRGSQAGILDHELFCNADLHPADIVIVDLCVQSVNSNSLLGLQYCNHPYYLLQIFCLKNKQWQRIPVLLAHEW